MTDKYEQFKEWFKHHPTDEDEIDLVFAIGNLFKEFENEQKEKEKKREIKEAIHNGVMEVTTRIDSYGDWTETVYQKLKEKDLIK